MKDKLGFWITNGTAKPFYARKEFRLERLPLRARAYATGLGQFVLRVNGHKAGDHELDPGWTDYRKYIQYLSFDLLPYLEEGENVIGAETGNGWYSMELSDGNYTFSFPSFMPPNPNPYKPFGPELVFSLRLEMEYEDGTSETIISDSSWKTLPHAVTSSNVYGSERIDGRLVPEGWDRPGFDESAWDAARLSPAPEAPLEEQRQPPIKVIKTYEARFLHSVNGRDIYDLGQNLSGILEFEARGKRGDEVRIYPAEKLGSDGDADQFAKLWLPINTKVTYIIGKDDTWESCRMAFTYIAGRYLALEGKAEIRNLKAHAITSAWKEAGSFSSDDERYNKIYDLVEKAVEANMLSVHTDCPTIERFAWQEPNHLMAPSIFYMKDANGLWRKFFKDLRVSQHSASDTFRDLEGNEFSPGDGLVPSQAPCYIPNALPVAGMGSFYDIIAWGSSCILGPYWHYLFYGEKDVIEENYETGLRYLSYLQSKVTEDGFINHGLGDWGNPTGEAARENTETAFLYADAAALAYFASILGLKEDQERLLSYAEEVRENYNKKLLIYDEAKGRYFYRVWGKEGNVMTQASEALPLYWGIVPEDKTRDVEEAFKEILLSDGAFLCGEVSHPYVIQTAARCGMNETISRYILKERHPSYYAFVLDGETTLGEYWEKNPRSHCHDMMGHIIEWYYNGIGGILPLEPGFRKVLVKPYLPESMKHAEISYDSASGEIRVELIRKEDGSVSATVMAAEGIEVVTELP